MDFKELQTELWFPGELGLKPHPDLTEIFILEIFSLELTLKWAKALRSGDAGSMFCILYVQTSTLALQGELAVGWIIFPQREYWLLPDLWRDVTWCRTFKEATKVEQGPLVWPCLGGAGTRKAYSKETDQGSTTQPEAVGRLKRGEALATPEPVWEGSQALHIWQRISLLPKSHLLGYFVRKPRNLTYTDNWGK